MPTPSRSLPGSPLNGNVTGRMSTKSPPSCLLITAARNEAQYIEKTIRSMVTQNVHPTKWVIVNDGSTDETPQIIDKYTLQYPWIERLDMPVRRERNFG